MMEEKIPSAFHTAVSWESMLCLQGTEAQSLGFKHLPFPSPVRPDVLRGGYVDVASFVGMVN